MNVLVGGVNSEGPAQLVDWTGPVPQAALLRIRGPMMPIKPAVQAVRNASFPRSDHFPWNGALIVAKY